MVSHNEIIVGLGILLSSCTVSEHKGELASENLDANSPLVSYQSFELENGVVSLLPTYIRAKAGLDEIVDQMGLTGNIQLGKCVVLVDDALNNRRTALIFPKDSASRDDQGRLIFMDKTWEEGEELSVGVLPNDYKPSNKKYEEIDVNEKCNSRNFFFIVA
jgi:hypothetical protein